MLNKFGKTELKLGLGALGVLLVIFGAVTAYKFASPTSAPAQPSSPDVALDKTKSGDTSPLDSLGGKSKRPKSSLLAKLGNDSEATPIKNETPVAVDVWKGSGNDLPSNNSLPANNDSPNTNLFSPSYPAPATTDTNSSATNNHAPGFPANTNSTASSENTIPGNVASTNYETTNNDPYSYPAPPSTPAGNSASNSFPLNNQTGNQSASDTNISFADTSAPLPDDNTSNPLPPNSGDLYSKFGAAEPTTEEMKNTQPAGSSFSNALPPQADVSFADANDTNPLPPAVPSRDVPSPFDQGLAESKSFEDAPLENAPTNNALHNNDPSITSNSPFNQTAESNSVPPTSDPYSYGTPVESNSQADSYSASNAEFKGNTLPGNNPYANETPVANSYPANDGYPASDPQTIPPSEPPPVYSNTQALETNSNPYAQTNPVPTNDPQDSSSTTESNLPFNATTATGTNQNDIYTTGNSAENSTGTYTNDSPYGNNSLSGDSPYGKAPSVPTPPAVLYQQENTALTNNDPTIDSNLPPNNNSYSTPVAQDPYSVSETISPTNNQVNNTNQTAPGNLPLNGSEQPLATTTANDSPYGNQNQSAISNPYAEATNAQPTNAQPTKSSQSQQPKQQPKRQPIQEEQRYQVQTGDTYWNLSERAYGNNLYFKALAEYNQYLVPKGTQLKSGDEIVIPPQQELEQRFPDLISQTEQNSHSVADNSYPISNNSKSSRTTIPSVASPTHSRSEGQLVAKQVYTVQEGDTLFDIARFALGKATRWVEIYELNRSTLGDNVDLLKPGTELLLPARTVSRSASNNTYR